MNIKVITNSVGTRNVLMPNSNNTFKIFPEIIEAEYFYHFLILGALWRLRKINNDLNNKDALIIYNIGINDCVFRKDNRVQLAGFQVIYDEAKVNGDLETMNFIQSKMDYLRSKPLSDIFQLLNFNDFENYIDIVFKETNKGIVLSIVYVNQSSKIVGYGYNEFVKVNEILERKATQYGFPFIDLFHTPNLTFDDVHLTDEGHKYVAKKIMEIIERKV